MCSSDLEEPGTYVGSRCMLIGKRGHGMSRLWRVWKYALGSFADERTKRYDNHVVIVRSIIFFSYLITNCFIIAGVIRHWN